MNINADIAFNISHSSDYFDRVIGHIEDIVVEDEFKALQRNFFENHYEIFEDNEENKFEYTEIFNEYTKLLENFIVGELGAKMENFDMEFFVKELKEQKPHLDGEIFELLLSLLDFLTFKELILDYRAEKEGRQKDIQFDIKITKITDLHSGD